MISRAYLRAGVLENYRQTVLGLGGDPEDLLAKADVSPDALAISGAYITYASYLELHRLTAEVLGCPHFGLVLTRVSNAETLGMTGFLMLQADTVGEAWRTLAQVYRAHDTYGTAGFEIRDGLAAMSYHLPRIDLPGCRGAFDAAAGIATNIMRQFCGDSWCATALRFPYPAPADLSVYDHLCAGSLQFDAPRFEMLFTLDWESLRLWSSNPDMHAILNRYFSGFESGRRRATKERVEEIVRSLLPHGSCGLQRVASMLSLSPRGLQARLASEQSSFQQVLDHVRKEIAIHHLTCGDMQLTQLAMILGYSELSAFTRSFKRWFGQSPREYLRKRPLPG